MLHLYCDCYRCPPLIHINIPLPTCVFFTHVKYPYLHSYPLSAMIYSIPCAHDVTTPQFPLAIYQSQFTSNYLSAPSGYTLIFPLSYDASAYKRYHYWNCIRWSEIIRVKNTCGTLAQRQANRVKLSASAISLPDGDTNRRFVASLVIVRCIDNGGRTRFLYSSNKICRTLNQNVYHSYHCKFN